MGLGRPGLMACSSVAAELKEPAQCAGVRLGTVHRTRQSTPPRAVRPAGTLSRKTGPLNGPVTGANRYAAQMGELIGYARCSTVLQDLTAQQQALAALGVPHDRIYLDKGLTGTSRARPGLDQALAAVRRGDTLVVPKLDRLARSVPDARQIGDSLVACGIKLSLGGTIYDPADPLGKMFFNILATFAEFEVDLLRLRTREGMAVARAKGRLRGKQPKLTARQQAELAHMHGTGEYTIAELMEVFSVGRATVYRTIERLRTHA